MMSGIALEDQSGSYMKQVAIAAALSATFICLMMIASTSAWASASPTTVQADGSLRTTYTVGPLTVTSGQNRIDYRPISGFEKPAVNGWITRIQPNLVYADGSIPSSSKVMFHHGVWLNTSRNDATSGGAQRFYATGEEKTINEFPPGYGYRYRASDVWLLNHMIHNLTPEPMELYITYTLDFIPDSAPQAASIKPVRPIWMDVENGSIYPVFDTYRDSGGADGEFVYPQDRPDAYPTGEKKNEWTVNQDGVLLSTAGHVHTGGLATDLYLKREGAGYAGPVCEQPTDYDTQLGNYVRWIRNISARQKKLNRSMAPKKVKRMRRYLPRKKFKRIMKKKYVRKAVLRREKRKKVSAQDVIKGKDRDAKAAYAACAATQPSVTGNRVHLFESKAEYFEPAGPVSWDMAVTNTRPDWRVQVKAGDTLELQTTYETKRASWYENMGINIVYMANGETGGADPYSTKVDQEGILNHGHYTENEDHGGGSPVVGPDPATLPNGIASSGPFNIGGYSYGAGNFRLPGEAGRPPVIQQGQSFSFQLTSGDASQEIWHSLTSCKSPCNKSTGIAYPIADGDFQFDSGQLGTGGPPTVNRTTWSTPADLPVGTHTFYCRIHPLMRGAIRVVKPNGTS